MNLAQVVLRESLLNYDKLYSYLIPDELVKQITVGARVLIPFGRANSLREGFVVKIGKVLDNEINYKKILKAFDENSVFLPDQIKLAELITKRYMCTWGSALRLMLPSSVSMSIKYRIALTEKALDLQAYLDDDGLEFAELKLLNQPLLQEQQKILIECLPVFNFLWKSKKHEKLLSEVQKKFNLSDKNFNFLKENGYVEIKESINSGMKSLREKTVFLPNRQLAIDLIEDNKIKYLHQLRLMQLLLEYSELTVDDCSLICDVSRSVIDRLVKKKWLEYGWRTIEEEESGEDIIRSPKLNLTVEQGEVLANLETELRETINKGEWRENLLFGITGSGKTEIYLQLTEFALQQNLGVIILVPEIALTPQMTAVFKSRFGGNIAVLHSRLTPREKYEQWLSLANGKVKIAVGARSAIFAPVNNLGLIIVDEEQESSYQADNHPRYDARTVARFRCSELGAMLLLGSATPSMEAYHRTVIGKAKLHRLLQRPGVAEQPQVRIVDMRKENKNGNYGIYSEELLAACSSALAKGEQAIILLNRRGFAGTYLCRDCGYVQQCPNCSINMTYHSQGQKLICHYCGYIENTPKKCPNCCGEHIGGMGIGTQQAETILKELLPQAGILRMDQDTTATRLSHSELLTAFRKHEVDILIGTQMIAKGHDFPNVTVVGILAAEKSLMMSDFRSSERAFQLFTQAAGRAGRGTKPGTVYLQTYNPSDYAITCAVKQDYEQFYNQEIRYRQALQYPPLGAILTIQASDLLEEGVRQFFTYLYMDLQEKFKDNRAIKINPPMRAPIWMLNKRIYWQMLLMGDDAKSLAVVMKYISRLKLNSNIRLSWNLDG